jgi:hypothetical protein
VTVLAQETSEALLQIISTSGEQPGFLSLSILHLQSGMLAGQRDRIRARIRDGFRLQSCGQTRLIVGVALVDSGHMPAMIGVDQGCNEPQQRKPSEHEPAGQHAGGGRLRFGGRTLTCTANGNRKVTVCGP